MCLDRLYRNSQRDDILLVTELSRLGRSLLDVMSLLHQLMRQQVKVVSIKEGYEFGDTLNAKILAFAFSLGAEIEHSMISARTREALARLKQEGKPVGRPKGSLSKKTKLTGKEEEIRLLLDKQVSVSAIARIMDVHRKTVTRFINTRLRVLG